MFDITPYSRRRSNTAVYNPFRDMDALERAFWGNGETELFRTDIKDNGDSYSLEAELPGFKKEDIKLELNDNLLTVKAERKTESNEKDEKNNYVRRERSYGSFSRSFDMTGIDVGGVKAAYEDGILKLTLPKVKEEAPKTRTIEIE